MTATHRWLANTFLPPQVDGAAQYGIRAYRRYRPRGVDSLTFGRGHTSSHQSLPI